RHLRGVLRGADLGAARHPRQADWPAQRGRLLRPAAGVDRRCRRRGVHPSQAPLTAARRRRTLSAARRTAELSSHSTARQVDRAWRALTPWGRLPSCLLFSDRQDACPHARGRGISVASSSNLHTLYVESPTTACLPP